jgi:hypothetical protein
MHDTKLEERLRRTLREEGDSLPFTLTVDVLEARLARRYRASRNARFGLLASAAAIIVAVGAIFAVLNNRSDHNVGVTPSPSAVASPSAVVVPSTSPAASPSPVETPRQSERPTGAIGAPDDAVIVDLVGDPAHPDRIDVSLMKIDAGAFETNFAPRILVQFAGSTIPGGYKLGSADPKFADPAPKFGQDGWLALGVVETATSTGGILIYDLRSPDAAPWLIPGNLDAASWGPGSTLAVVDGSDLRLYDAHGETTGSVALPADVKVAEDITYGTDYSMPTWLADGNGFVTQRGSDFVDFVFGTVGLDGSFTATDVSSPVLQVTGTERRWGVDGSELGGGCPTEGGPPGCSVSVSKLGRAATNWYWEDLGLGGIVDYEWDADGNGVWLLVNRTPGDQAGVGQTSGAGKKTLVLMHADEPGKFNDVQTITMDLGANAFPSIVGLRDADATADSQLFLLGSPQIGQAQAGSILSGDTHGSFRGSGFFVGWAGAQDAYPKN